MTATYLRVLFALTASTLLAAMAAMPDSWMPFVDRRQVSTSGRRYAVVKKVAGKPGAGHYSLCRRLGGAPPMQPATRNIARDPKDVLLASGPLDQLPMEILLADSFDGMLLFDKHGNVGHGKTIRWIDGTGKVTAECTLKDLFGGPPKGSMTTTSSIWWSRDVSIDERRKSIVVVSIGLEVRESLETVIRLGLPVNCGSASPRTSVRRAWRRYCRAFPPVSRMSR